MTPSHGGVIFFSMNDNAGFKAAKSQTRETGSRGEAIARKYLKMSGYEIIASNYRSRRLEIDIISQKEGRLIFFEVKTRFEKETDKTSVPISPRQINNLKRAIAAYCFEKRARLERAHLDLIVIYVSRATGLASLRHYRDIF